MNLFFISLFQQILTTNDFDDFCKKVVPNSSLRAVFWSNTLSPMAQSIQENLELLFAPHKVRSKEMYHHITTAKSEIEKDIRRIGPLLDEKTVEKVCLEAVRRNKKIAALAWQNVAHEICLSHKGPEHLNCINVFKSMENPCKKIPTDKDGLEKCKKGIRSTFEQVLDIAIAAIHKRIVGISHNDFEAYMECIGKINRIIGVHMTQIPERTELTIPDTYKEYMADFNVRAYNIYVELFVVESSVIYK